MQFRDHTWSVGDYWLCRMSCSPARYQIQTESLLGSKQMADIATLSCPFSVDWKATFAEFVCHLAKIGHPHGSALNNMRQVDDGMPALPEQLGPQLVALEHILDGSVFQLNMRRVAKAANLVLVGRIDMIDNSGVPDGLRATRCSVPVVMRRTLGCTMAEVDHKLLDSSGCWLKWADEPG